MGEDGQHQSLVDASQVATISPEASLQEAVELM